MPYLTDPAWLAIWLAVLALITPIAFWFVYQRRTKKLTYRVLVNEPLLTINETISGAIKILFHDQPVQDVQLFVIEIQNSGNQSILEEHFNTPLTITFNSQTRILTYELTDTEPPELTNHVDCQLTDDNQLTIAPLLLNKNDKFQIKTILTVYKTQPIIEARIVDISHIEPYDPTPRRLRVWFLMTLTITVFGIIATAFMYWAFGSPAVGLGIFSTLYFLGVSAFSLAQATWPHIFKNKDDGSGQ